MSEPVNIRQIPPGTRIALVDGSLAEVAIAVRKRVGRGTHENILIFDHASGKTLNLNLSGTEADVRGEPCCH